jgi:hypothetical protein
MVSSITDSQSSNVLAGLSPKPATPSASASSFTDQLVAALEGYLSQSAGGSNLEIDIQTTQSQDSGVRQFLVTVKNPDGAPAPTVTAPSTSASVTGFVSVPQAAASAPQAAASTPANSNASASTKPATPMNELDAYWAAQPEPVQQLRDMDPAPRAQLAQQLADKGYTIDNAIMVWGWDPVMTMQARQQYGYTWVPSWNQPNASTPGLAVGKQIPYDPNNAPAGSIAVNTDFTKSLNA